MGTSVTKVQSGNEANKNPPVTIKTQAKSFGAIFNDFVFAENGDIYLKKEVSQKDKLLHYELSWLAQDAYRGDGDKRGYTELTEYYKDYFWGFKARVYKNEKDNTVVIAYSGTDGLSPCDMWNNLIIKCGGIPPQYDHAMDLYLEVSNNDEIKKSGAKIIVIGHSLGGNLAQFVASTTKYDGKEIKPPSLGISYNAPPCKDNIDADDDDECIIQDNGNMIFCSMPGDKLTTENLQEAVNGQPGTIMMFGTEAPKIGDGIKDKLNDKIRDIVAGVSLTAGETSNNELIEQIPSSTFEELLNGNLLYKSAISFSNPEKLYAEISKTNIKILTKKANEKLKNIPAGSSLFPEHSIIRFMENPLGFANGKYFVRIYSKAEHERQIEQQPKEK